MKSPTPSRPRPVALWRRLWSEFSINDRRRLAAAAVLMVLASALTAALPLLIGGLIDRSLAAHEHTVAKAASGLPIIGVLVVVAELLQVARRQLVEAVATGFERDARDAAYRHLLRLDLGRLRENQVGRIYGRANRSIEGAVRLVKLGAMDLLPAVTLAVLAIVVAFVRAPLAAAAMAMVIPTGFALVFWQVSSQAGVRLLARDRKEEIDGQVVELLPLLEVVRTTGADEHFASGISAVAHELRDTDLRHHRAMSMFDAAKAINEGLWLVITLGVTIGVSGHGAASAGQITAMVLLYAGVTQPLGDLHRIIDEASESGQQTADLFDLLDEPEDVSYATPSRTSTERQRSVPRSGPAIDMRGVHFDFISAEDVVPVLDAFELQVLAGERIGMVGPSGCGKSTALRLMCRLLHAGSGSIRLDGRDIADLSREELVGTVGYVSQHPAVFRMSVAQNILLGSPDGSLSDAEHAADRAHLHDEILRLPEGYDTIVSERGETLSGGQRQRLSLARALVQTPPILLLDEATSALDEDSQTIVSDAISALSDVTLIVVAHRVSTLRSMDRVVRLDRGRVAETLSYDDLIARAERWPSAESGAPTLTGDAQVRGDWRLAAR